MCTDLNKFARFGEILCAEETVFIVVTWTQGGRMEGADESTELFLPPIVWNRTEKVIQVERVVGKKYWERQRESLKKKEWERWRKKNRDECEKDREMEKERKKERSEKEREIEREKWEREIDRKTEWWKEREREENQRTIFQR